jgi:transcriptional regulator with XRE-family HTH domain
LPFPRIQQEVSLMLTLLREKIRQRGYNQLRVQEALGWGRTYISQLLRQQKSLRFDQIMQILHVIGEQPRDFFGEYVRRIERAQHGETIPPCPPRPEATGPAIFELAPFDEDDAIAHREVRYLLDRLGHLLVEKRLIRADELESLIRASRWEAEFNS